MKLCLKIALALSVMGMATESMANIGIGELLEGQDTWSQYNEPCACSCDAYIDVGFRALSLKPCGSNLNYAVEVYPSLAHSPHWKIHDIHPKHDFGYDIAVGLTFCDCKTHISLNWEHFRSQDNASKCVHEGKEIRPLYEISLDNFYSSSKARVHYKYDSIHLDYGIIFDPWGCFQSELYAGVNAVRIRESRTTKFSHANNRSRSSLNVPSTFRGLGPEFGVDFSFGIWRGIQLSGDASASLLVGKHHGNTKYSYKFSRCAEEDSSTYKSPCSQKNSKTLLVPAFEGRLGFSYEFCLCGCYDINFEAGYEAKIYIDVIQSNHVSHNSTNSDRTNRHAFTFHRSIDNFALSGPYVSLDVNF